MDCLKISLISIVLVSLMAVSAYSISWSDAFALYALNETSNNTNAIDSIGGIGDVPVTGVIGVQTGHISGARGPYPASGNYFEKTGVTQPNGLSSFAIGLWVKPLSNTPTDNEQFIHGHDSELVFRYKSNSLEVMVNNGATCNMWMGNGVAVTWTANKWEYILFSYDNATGKCAIWKNATKIKEVNSEAISVLSTYSLELGNNQQMYETVTDFYMEQISFWNRSADQTLLDWLYNNSAGQGYAIEAPAPDEYLGIEYVWPTGLPAINYSNFINFSVIVTSSNEINSCILNLNWSLGGILNTTDYPIANNTQVNWTNIYLANDTYTFNMSCNDGVDLYNDTGIMYMDIVVPNITEPEPEIPPANYTGASYKVCLTNTTLYTEKVYTEDGVSHNETESVYCDYGCANNACNVSAYAKWLNYGYLFCGVLVALILIAYLSRHGRKIGF